jgi:hypothetical protein
MIYSMANINFTLFSDLKNIDLSRNQIEIIPAEISKLPFLEVLNLSYNKLVCTSYIHAYQYSMLLRMVILYRLELLQQYVK